MTTTKTYTEAIDFISSMGTKNYFNDQMAGGYGTHGGINDMCLTVAHIYGVKYETVKDAVYNSLNEKKEKLIENWSDAVRGEYNFF